MEESRKKKLKHSIISGVLAISLIATGTFAWQSISQDATNELAGIPNPGARLHDDFNGQNKDIYVENYTDPDNGGVNIYARVRLSEYMEIGEDAGNEDNPSRDVEKIGKEDGDITDPDTWLIHKPAQLQGGDPSQSMHQYWDWVMGNENDQEDKYYMPTFNKNNESLDADINGTLAGLDNDKSIGTPYDDYEEWTAGSIKTDYETLNEDTQSDQEEQHTAQKLNYKSKVITIDEWKTSGKNTGDFWVYDNDGWAYWANPVKSGETTGLLLNEVKSKSLPEDEYYYAIHASGQFATGGDWDGFEDDGFTEDAEELLNKAAGRETVVSSMAPVKGYNQFATVADPFTLEVNVSVNYPTGSPAETNVDWSVEEEEAAECLDGNTFTPTEELVGNTYKFTATSRYTPSVSTYINVTVLPSGINEDDAVDGADNSKYIDFGNNVYKRIEDDGTLSDFICAGMDKQIGNTDDKLNVYDIASELGVSDPTYGRFFLPAAGNKYKAMGADKMLGTEDDIYVISATGDWPNNISTKLADQVKVTPVDNNTSDNKVKIGQNRMFKAEVTLLGKPISNQKVTWSITGNGDPNTQISPSGLLSIGSNEAVGKLMYVIATSQEDPTHAVGSFAVEVAAIGYEDLANVEAGSTQSVLIDGNYYYVLAKDGDKALLWSKNSLLADKYGSTPSWSTSTIRTTLNSTWINSKPTLNAHVLNDDEIIDIYTRTTNSATASWATTKDRVFLLSEADLFDTTMGQAASTRDYTYMGKKLPVLPAMLKDQSGQKGYWLRGFDNNSLSSGADKRVANVTSNGKLGGLDQYESKSSITNGIRPAFWIKME